jgi:uncharacterized protein YcbK (DUF882 family)
MDILQSRKASNSLILRVSELGKDFQLSENLTLGEFASQDGYNLVLVHPALIVGFQEVRDSVGVPLRVMSGYRSEKRNREIGGSPGSLHTLGMAIDVCPIVPQDKLDHFLGDIERVAFSIGMGGVRWYEKNNFVHMDVGRRRTW